MELGRVNLFFKVICLFESGFRLLFLNWKEILYFGGGGVGVEGKRRNVRREKEGRSFFNLGFFVYKI